MLGRILLTLFLIAVLWWCVVAPVWMAIRAFIFRTFWWMFPL